MKNYYKILEIPDFSDAVTIKKAYRDLSKRYHPDINPDPQAHHYFILLTEAYDFLLHPQKREQLNAVLSRSFARQEVKIEKQTTPLPFIKFTASAFTYSLNDSVILHWQVENAKQVFLDFVGYVSLSGKYALRIDKFYEILEVKLVVTDFNNEVHIQKIKLEYRDKDPRMEAARRFKKKYPDVNVEHFKPEHPLNIHGRISEQTYIFRLLFAVIFFGAVFWFAVSTDNTSIRLVSTSAFISFVFANTIKRLQDLGKDGLQAFRLFIPFYQFYFVYFLCRKQGATEVNPYGIYRPPEFTSISTAAAYYAEILKKYTLATRISISASLFTLLFPFLMAMLPTKEQQVPLQDYRYEIIENRGNHYEYHYILLNNEEIAVNKQDYLNIVNKVYDTFTVDYYYFINTVAHFGLKSTTAPYLNTTIYIGFFNSTNPSLIILGLLFLFQLYAVTVFKTSSYQTFLNYFMLFVLLVNISIWYNYLV